jgi:predicted nucleic acid-binding protein
MGAPVDVGSLSFLTVRAPADAARVQQLRTYLDPGESEAIALALEVRADALLIDELQGRAAAVAAGLNVIGVLGILQRAKHEGLIDQVRSRMDRLRNDTQFFISDRLYDEVLRSVGETTGP